MTANTWPNPARPGAPQNPERDGWHLLQAKYYDDPADPFMAFFWDATQQTWLKMNPYGSAAFHYRGPVLTSDEAAALQARADRNAAGFARVDAELGRVKFLHKQEIAALQKRVADLEAALDFYACVDHYQTHNAVAPNVVQTDRGAKARAALGGKDE